MHLEVFARPRLVRQLQRPRTSLLWELGHETLDSPHHRLDLGSFRSGSHTSTFRRTWLPRPGQRSANLHRAVLLIRTNSVSCHSLSELYPDTTALVGRRHQGL